MSFVGTLSVTLGEITMMASGTVGPPQSSLLNAALAYAALGWPVFPCRNKKPRTKHGVLDASTDPTVVANWWTTSPDAQIGLRMGAASGLFAVDLDPKHDGFTTWKGLVQEHGSPPTSRVQRTPSGGEHILFRYPGFRIKNTTSEIGPGFDTRGDGGYIIAAPSSGPNGQAYEWTATEATADAPQWLLDLLRGLIDDGPEPEPTNGGQNERYVQAALDDEARIVATASEGTRNSKLNAAALKMGHYVGGGHLTRDEVEAALIDAARRSGLVKEDGLKAVKATIASGLKAGMAKPRDPPEPPIAPTRAAKKGGKGGGGGGAPPPDDLPDLPLDVGYEDFVALMTDNQFIFRPTSQLWPASSVNARLPWIVPRPDAEPISPASWLRQTQPVEQWTWVPGEPQIIRDRLIVEGGWIELTGAHVFNQYKPPTIKLGDAREAKRWCDLLHKLWPDDAGHLINCFAHRRQRPGEKINHALVLGGPPGIGKDTVLQAVAVAIGPWNLQDIGPPAFVQRFNGFAKAVILRISEARDTSYDRYQFYEHMKVYAAAPPDTQRIDEKNRREYYVPNLCLPVITTNHKTNGVYLPADDRRHYVAWSDLTKDDFTEQYWKDLWHWYEREGGFGHVAAFLDAVDLAAFNPKAPPPKTEAFWTIVNASRASEDAELADALDKLGNPVVTTLNEVMRHASGDFLDWLTDRKNRRNLPHRFEACGYLPVRNPDRETGLWVINGERQVVYGHRDHDRRTHIARIRLMNQGKKT